MLAAFYAIVPNDSIAIGLKKSIRYQLNGEFRFLFESTQKIQTVSLAGVTLNLHIQCYLFKQRLKGK